MVIKAVLQGKSRGYEYMEDVLTSTVFGTLNYLPSEKGIIPFVENAVLYDKNMRLWEALRDNKIGLRCYKSIKMFFWTKHTIYGEPDLILLFTDHVHHSKDLLLVVEAKFKSDKSGTGDNDQLMRYYEAITKDLHNFYNEEIKNFNGITGYIIYLTESEAMDEIAESVSEIKKNDAAYTSSIFHLRWRQLHYILINNINEFSAQEKIIARDIIDYMEKLGLGEFSGITMPDEDIISVANNLDSCFFANGNNKKHSHTYFDELNAVDINENTFCFYRGSCNE